MLRHCRHHDGSDQDTVLSMYLVTQSKKAIAALELKRQIGVSYKTAWMMKHKLLEVMAQREASRQLAGRVEIDDAYLGGECTGGEVGRGSENKIPFIAAVQPTGVGIRCMSGLTW